MTLIELMLTYQDLLRSDGRASALVFLRNVCDHNLWSHIQDSFNDSGDFLGADGKTIIVGDGRFLWVDYKG